MFVKGKSGNPGGRKKGDLAAQIARAVFDHDPQAIGRAMLKALKRGNPKVYTALAERGYGRLPQPVALAGEDGGPIQFTFVEIGRRASRQVIDVTPSDEAIEKE